MDAEMIAQERRERLEFDRWKADRNTRMEAMDFVVSLTEEERHKLGGPVAAAKEIERYLRNG